MTIISKEHGGIEFDEKSSSQGVVPRPSASALPENLSDLSVSKTQTYSIKNPVVREFPGGPVVRTLRFHCRGPGFDPWSEN